jgi:ATP-dependent exoDNAse (exonuclease V) beta subunit
LDRPLKQGQAALLLAPIQATGRDKDTLYEYICRQQQIKATYETDRLLYVATTRAKKRLFLLFNVLHNEQNNYRIESGSFLEKMWPFLQNQLDQVIIANHSTTWAQETTVPVLRKEKSIARLKLAWKNPIEKFIQKKFTYLPSLANKNFSQVLPTNQQSSQTIGIVTHRILQLISQLGVTWWTNRNEQEQQIYLFNQFHQLHVTKELLASSIKITKTILYKALNDARGQWILHAHTDARSEFQFTVVLNKKIKKFVIDRTFTDSSGTRWIIDYKTTALSTNDVQVFLAQEQQKYLDKMHQYACAMQFIDQAPIRLGLYFPALPAWHEWDFSVSNAASRSV